MVGVGAIYLVYTCLYCAGVFGYHHIADFEEPTRLTRFEVHAGHEVLWRIESRNPPSVKVLDYGVVPLGFRQTVPAGERPRPLRSGEDLLIAYTTPTYWTRHDGAAVGAAAFKGGSWYSGPLANMPVSEIFK